MPPLSSLKKTPVYSEPPEKTILPKDQLSPHHPVLGSVEFMVSTLTNTLKDLKDEMWGIKEQVSRVEDRPPNQTRPTSPGTIWGGTLGLVVRCWQREAWSFRCLLILGQCIQPCGRDLWSYCQEVQRLPTAVAFVKACQAVPKPKPKDPCFAFGEGPPDGSSDWTYKSARGGLEQPVLFHQQGRETTDPKDPTLILEERHSMERFWYAVVNGRHGVWNIFRSWEEVSKFVLGYPGALVEKFKTRGKAMAFWDCHKIRLDGKEVITPSNKFRTDDEAPKTKVTGDPDYLPPMILIGRDPSAKKSNEVFGVHLGSEMDSRGS